MTKQIYKISGWTLILISILVAIYAIIQSFHWNILTRGFGEGDFFYELIVKGFIPSAIAFLLGIFQGREYIKISKGKIQTTKLTTISLVLLIISISLTMLYLILVSLISIQLGFDPFGAGLLAIFFIWPIAILYGISLILITLNYFIKKKN